MANTKDLAPNGKRYIPVAQVSFHTDSKCYRLTGTVKGPEAFADVSLGGNADPTSQLISVTTNKTIDAPAGTFSIVLAGDEWFLPDNTPILKPNDLVVIYMGYQAENNTVTLVDGSTQIAANDLDTVMVGLIDTVTLDKNGGGNSFMPSVQTTITGRDFGKVLIKSMLKFYPQLGAGNTDGQKFILTETGWLSLMKAFANDDVLKGTPAKILDTIIRFILKPLVSSIWSVYDDNTHSATGEDLTGYKPATIANMMRYTLAQTDFFIPFFLSAQQYEGSIWNLMSKVNLKPFTEMFIDTRDYFEACDRNGEMANSIVEEYSSADKQVDPETPGSWSSPVLFGTKDNATVLLTYRNTPFDDASWGKLRTHTVEDADIIHEKLSFSDNENYNLFWAGSTLTPFSDLRLKEVSPPVLNEENVTRYGLNPLEINVEGLQIDPSQDSLKVTLEGLSKSLSEKLQQWFGSNIDHLSGSVTMRGKGSVKIGQRFIHSSLNRDFYIEGVTQNFQVYGDWQTQVTLTRGKLLPPVGAIEVGSAQVTVATSAAASTSEATTQTSVQYHTVSGSDTLWSIATKYYSDGNQWTKIWEANKDTLIARDSRNANDPGHWIYDGQVLTIP